LPFTIPVVNATGWRRWALPIHVVLLGLWVLALVVDFVVFDGPSSPLHWIAYGVVTLLLVVRIAAELKARAEAR
jgi:hypothetical protein